jgi:hypothetical protein
MNKVKKVSKELYNATSDIDQALYSVSKAYKYYEKYLNYDEQNVVDEDLNILAYIEQVSTTLNNARRRVIKLADLLE